MTSSSLNQLDFGRQASFILRFAMATEFRDEGVPGADERTRLFWRNSVVGRLSEAGSGLRLASRPRPWLGRFISLRLVLLWRILRDIHYVRVRAALSPALRKARSRKIILARIDALRKRVEQVTAADGPDQVRLGELHDLFTKLNEATAATYVKHCAEMLGALPVAHLEFGYHETAAAEDTLPGTALSAACRPDDGEGPASIVRLGVRDDAFDWWSARCLPYVLVHELLCHAYQGLHGSGREPVDKECGWSEGWMDALASWYTEDWLAASSGASVAAWVRDHRKDLMAATSSLHENRITRDGTLSVEARDRRITMKSGARNLQALFQCSATDDSLSKEKLYQFSLLLNVISMPQQCRNDIADTIAILLEPKPTGAAREKIVMACNRFMEDRDWQKFHARLKDIVGY